MVGMTLKPNLSLLINPLMLINKGSKSHKKTPQKYIILSHFIKPTYYQQEADGVIWFTHK